MDVREIGQRIGVASILARSARQRGDRSWIAAQLIDAADEAVAEIRHAQLPAALAPIVSTDAGWTLYVVGQVGPTTRCDCRLAHAPFQDGLDFEPRTDRLPHSKVPAYHASRTDQQGVFDACLVPGRAVGWRTCGRSSGGYPPDRLAPV